MISILKEFEGLTWKECKEFLKGNAHLIALCPENDVCELVLKGIKESTEIGIVTLIAALFLEKNGTGHTIEAAVDLYKKGIAIKKKKGVESLSQITEMVRNLECELACSDRCRSYPKKKPVWPIAMPFRKPEKMAGLANIMLFMASRELMKGPSNTDIVSVHGIMNFLNEQQRRAEKHNVK